MIVIASVDGTSESNGASSPIISLMNVLALQHTMRRLQKRYKQNHLIKR